MWPTPQEFNEAIQDPYLCFEDKDLTESTVVLNPLGLPRSITGAFASVYQLKSKKSVFAVRCFLEERAGLSDRYKIIEECLKEIDFDPFVKFKFIERGIRVRGSWYPIQKMQWIDGSPLDQYLAKHFKNPEKVLSLRDQFEKLVLMMEEKGVAHGDLQHGNILVSKGKLYLVDYDGMFVPRLSGSESVELGHRNYQHPRRDNSNFSSNLDNFSSWIILNSLSALSYDPSLWSRFDLGDECLLFRYRDLRDPKKSQIFAELSNHEEQEVRKLGATILKLLRIKPQFIPSIQASAEEIDELLEDDKVLVEERPFQSQEDPFGYGSLMEVSYDERIAWRKKNVAKLVPSISVSKKLKDRLQKIKERGQMHIFCLFAPDYWAEASLLKGIEAYDVGNYAEAIKTFKLVSEVFSERRDPKMWAFESNIRLGYSYVKTNQHGTAAHYFREAERFATILNSEDLSVRATLLLASTYFDSGQAERSYDLVTGSAQSARNLSMVVRQERDGAFGDSLTIPNLLLNIGHIYLDRDDSARAIFCFESAIEFCQWIFEGRIEKEVKHLVRRALTGYCLAKFDDPNNHDEIFSLFRKNLKSSSSLARLIESEKSSRLFKQLRYAEFLRLAGARYYADEEFKHSNLAYGAALEIYKRLSDYRDSDVFIADCLLAVGSTPEAIKILLLAHERKQEINIDLIGKLESVYEFHYAVILSSIISGKGSYKQRNRCLNYLKAIAPSGESLSLSLKYLDKSKLNQSKNLAILLADCARDLTRANRASDAQEIYSTSFKIFQRAGLVDSDADRVIECLLSNDDLDTAARLLMESADLEKTVRAIVSATVKGNNFQLNIICEILVKVLTAQMNLPYEHVSDEELKVTLSLIKWIADDDDLRVIIMEEKCEIWQKRREMTLAHSMIDQGKFGAAIQIFEKFEGKTGPNVIQAYELWSMRYFTIALENREHSRLALVDGYAFGCAIEIISTLKEKGGLSQDFARRVAELVSRSSPEAAKSMEQHLNVLLEIFSTGGSFLEARDIILACLPGGEASSRYGGLFKVKSKTSQDEEAFDASPNEEAPALRLEGRESAYSYPESGGKALALTVKSREDEKLWKALHRALFLVDRERYGEAVKALTEFEKLDEKRRFVVDANIALGFCQYLLSNNRLAKAHFSKAVSESFGDRIESYYRASICLTQFALSVDLSKSNIRTLIDPSSQKKDIYRVAASLIKKTIELESDLAICLADQLYIEAEEHEGLQHMSYAVEKYEAALTIYGVMNEKRTIEIVDCLDAIRQYSPAASRLRDSKESLSEDDFHNIMMKLARRHVRTKELLEVVESFSREGLNISVYIDEVERDLVIEKLTRILTSAIPPERYMSQLINDIASLKNNDCIDIDYALKIARFIESNIGSCSSERVERLKDGFLTIADKLASVSSVAAFKIEKSFEEDGP